MRRTILIPILALLLSLGMVSNSGAAFYRGHGDGIRVAFRVKGDKLVWANVFVRLYCKRPNGERHLNRYKRNYASPEYPLELDGRGRFRWFFPEGLQEEGYEEEELLVGRVGHRFVTGHFEYSFSYSLRNRAVDCQTRSYPFGPSRLEFRARRR